MTRLLGLLSKALSYIGGLAILAMMGVTIVDIAMRNVFGTAIFGTYDFVLAMLVVSVFAGMAEAFRQEAHIKVDLIDGIASPRLRRAVIALALVLTSTALLLLVWLAVGQAADARFFGDITTDLHIPRYLFWVVIVIGLGSATIVLLHNLFETIWSDVDAVDETTQTDAGSRTR